MRALRQRLGWVGLLLSFTVSAQGLPPPPIIDQEQRLMRSASDTLGSSALWTHLLNSAGYPNTSFAYVPPSNNTNDLVLKTENCDQIGERGLPQDAGTGVCLFTVNPAAYTQPALSETFAPISKPWVLADSYFFPKPVAGAIDLYQRGDRFICDVNNLNTAAQPGLPDDLNPFPCDASGQLSDAGINDCYDLSHLGVLTETIGATTSTQLAGRRIRVVVRNPKSPTAQITNVLFQAPAQRGPAFPATISGTLTPVVSGDGQLLILDSLNGLQYSYNTKAPCDPGGWTQFLPISTMYQDPVLRAKYPIARFPLRDSENNLIAPTTDKGVAHSGIRGGYLWMDTNATMLFFNASIGHPPYYYDPVLGKVVQRYQATLSQGGVSHTPADFAGCNNNTSPAACFSNLLAPFVVPEDIDQSVGMVGLWTNGKVVVLDSPLNKNYFGLNSGVMASLLLYSGGGTTSVHDNKELRKGAFQNAYNALPQWRPDSPADVAWRVATQYDMDEVAFDDFIRRDALIVSPMNPSMTNNCLAGLGNCYGEMNDGVKVVGSQGLPTGFAATDAGFPHLQNQAASFSPGPNNFNTQTQVALDAGYPQWDVPAYGALKGGGRIEPISAGGVHGAGLYLNGSNWVEYSVPADNPAKMSTQTWFYGLWIDPTVTSTSQVLFGLSDGSALVFSDSTHLTLQAAHSGTSQALAVPTGLSIPAGAWSHVSVAVTPQGTTTAASLFLNGYQIGRFSVAGSALIPAPGGIVYLGGPGRGSFTGWVDELKVFGRQPSPEEICRQASGTLVGLVSAAADPTAWPYAGLFPSTEQTLISHLLAQNKKPAFNRYFCETNVPTAGIAGKTSYCISNLRRPVLQTAGRCIDNDLLFPEGPIVPDQARPNSTNNQFCQSCHVASHPSDSLTPTALTPSVQTTPEQTWIVGGGPLLMSKGDPKRRPLEPLQIETGVIPANLFCNGLPNAASTSWIFADSDVSLCGGE